MNTLSKKNKDYRTSFIWGTALGGLFLLLSVVAYVFEVIYPAVRGTLIWGCFLPAVLAFFQASLDYSRYLNSSTKISAQGSDGRQGRDETAC